MLQGGKLAIYHEVAALNALRNCAGALTDLVEGSVPGPFGSAGGPPAAEDKPEELGRWPIPKEEEKPDTEEKPKEKRKTAATASKNFTDSKRKAKKKDPKKTKRSRSRSPIEEEKDPVNRGTKKEKEKEKASSSKRARSPSKSPPRREEEREDEDTAERRREDKALPRYPVRGSVAEHFRGSIPGRIRPAEPLHPPPPGHHDRHHGGGDREDRRRDWAEEPEKAKKWRGFKHYNRGRDHWRSLKGRR